MFRISTLLLCAALSTTGCVTLPEQDSTRKSSDTSAGVSRGLSNDKVPVTADQIHDGNAKQMLANLEDEVRRATSEPIEISPDNN